MNNQLNLDRVVKLLGQKAIETLKGSTIAVVGQGSLGGQVTLWLAMSGVGGFILIDPDRLGSENLVRHVADSSYLLLPKVQAVRKLIYRRNPYAEVRALQKDARDEPYGFDQADLVIVAGLGSEARTGEVARILRNLGKPALFGGLYERALGGDVFYVDPHEGPCYACIASLVSDTKPVVDREINYGVPMDELKAQPGLVSSVSYGAMVLTNWALRILVADPQVLAPYPGNFFIFANEAFPIGTDKRTGKPVVLPPATGRWMTIPRLEGCLVCGGKEPPQDSGSIDDLLA